MRLKYDEHMYLYEYLQSCQRRGFTPSVAEVAEYLGVCNTAAFNRLKRLEEKGWIRRLAGYRRIQLTKDV